MIAQVGRIYIQVTSGVAGWSFTCTELPEWNNDMCLAVDITDLSPQPGIGWIYDGVSFSPPVAAPPEKVLAVTMRQARLQLLSLGLYDMLNTAIAAMGTAAQLNWEFASTVDRADPLTVELLELLAWTPEQADDFMLTASTL